MPRAPRPALLQIHNSFILAETRDGVIILDQHAAHERILYERIVAGLEGAGEEGQRLLFPFTLRLTKPELEVVESVRRPLARLGFDFSSFGRDAILVQSVSRSAPPLRRGGVHPGDESTSSCTARISCARRGTRTSAWP